MKQSEEEHHSREEDEYVEEEDEDFNPDEVDGGDDGDDGDDDGDEDEYKRSDDEETERQVKSANYSKIESSEGGLIKTRRQRQLETHEREYKSVLDLRGDVDVDEAWLKLQKASSDRLRCRYSANVTRISHQGEPREEELAHERIKIKRKYDYAGETVIEEKWVDRESAEAQEYLNGLKDEERLKVESSTSMHKKEQDKKPTNVNERGEKLRIVRKRPPLLEGIINGSIKPKFNTLEKSKLDFAQFVDKEGINDELVQHNKDGYLAKQDFLSRVEFHRDTQMKEMRHKELNKKK